MAGEMSKKDIEKGGDWYSVRLELEKFACKMGSKKFEVRHFDQYHGPYCFMVDLMGIIWKVDGDKFFFAPSRHSGLAEFENDDSYEMDEDKDLGKRIKKVINKINFHD